MTQTKTPRLGAMDDVRVILTLLGVILHACLYVGHTERGSSVFNFWMWIDGGIHVFRMQIFFLISGYLTWHAMSRPGYIKKRTRQLLLPAFSAWVIIIPLIADRQQLFHLLSGIDFYNVWFLGTLYILVVFNWILWRYKILGWITHEVKTSPIQWGLVVLGLQVIIAHILAVCESKYGWAKHFGFAHTIVLASQYEFYYLGGLLLAQIPRWRESLANLWWRIGGLLMWGVWMAATFMSPSLGANVPFATVTCILVCLGLMSVATHSSLDLTWTKIVCPASLTIYLWHLPLMELANNTLTAQGITLNNRWMFIWLCCTSLAGSLLAHAVIQRSAILRWMWLGENLSTPIGEIVWDKYKDTLEFVSGLFTRTVK